ncbi:MAG: hypothetical protein KKF44_09915 [Nanoarchaeota archaeon]|nr:hypothetical protein [Nanoarchaeota archaeon]
MKLRLHQFLSQTGLFSSKFDIEEAISSGNIQINGKICTKRNFQFNPNTRKITYKGKELAKIKEKLYIIFNKPTGYLSTRLTENDKYMGKKSMLDLVKDIEPDVKNTLSAVGRLDEETSGLIIISNDGKLNFFIASPENAITKTYEVVLEKALSVQDIELIKKGIVIKKDEVGQKIDSYTAKPISLEKISDTKYEIVIDEGKKREVRRIFLAIGNSVISLKRIAIGNIKLNEEKLKPGQLKKVSRKFLLENLNGN